jgi:hypothetical protein
VRSIAPLLNNGLNKILSIIFFIIVFIYIIRHLILLDFHYLPNISLTLLF